MHLQAHASGEVPDWEKLSPEERNIWQRLAAVTHGTITPGNLFTGLGVAATAVSERAFLQDRPVAGAVAATMEGWCDLADGWAATISGTRSPLGKKLDVATDQPRIASQIAVLTYKRYLPKTAAAALLAEKVAIALPSAIAISRGNEPTVSSESKVLTGLQRGLVLIFAGAKALQDRAEKSHHRTTRAKLRVGSQAVRGVAYAGLAASAALSARASWQYCKLARQPKKAGLN